MASCDCRPFEKPDRAIFRGTNRDYVTSSNRAHYYENVIDHPLNNLRVKRQPRKDLRFKDSVMLDLNRTNYQRSLDAKFTDHWDPSESMNRNSFDKPNLRTLHEKYMKDPVRPMKLPLSTTASHYQIPEEIHEPLSLPRKSLKEESTCPIRALGRGEFPSVPVNIPGYSKHLDIFVSTSTLGHSRFTEDQQNGVARKDIQTFYDMNGTPKCRGFGPKKSGPIGPYFHRDKTEPDNIRFKTFCRVPYFGKTSEYAATYDYVPTNLMHLHDEIQFPTLFGPSDFDVLATPAMYCTETCHIGTGWPVKATVDIGTVKGTF